MTASPKTYISANWQVIIIISVMGMLLMAPGFVLGHIIGQSSALNVNWAEGFAEQLQAGEFYPRWLPNMTGGAGSPVFYFYGPLPFYLAAPFVLATGKAALGVVCASTLLLIASGLACYTLCRHYAARDKALVAAIIYMVLPYHYDIDIWFRAALGEQAAFVFMPLAAYCVLNLKKSHRFMIGLALSYAGLLFSHLPSTLLFSPVLAFLTLWTGIEERSWMILLRAASAALISFGMAAIYLLPALTLQEMIQSERWGDYAPESNLMISSTTIDGFGLLLLPLTIISIVFVLLAVIGWKPGDQKNGSRPWIYIGIAVLAIISVLAAPFWLRAGFYRVVQFPWRALAIFDLCVVVLWASHWRAGGVMRDAIIMALGLAIFLCFVLSGISQSKIYTTADNPVFMSISAEQRDLVLKTDASEYLPSCLVILQSERFQITTAQNAKTVLATAAQAGVAKIYYYPFLHAKQDNRSIDLSCDPATGFSRLVAVGTSPVIFEKQALPIEIWAQFISTFSFVVLLSLGIVLALRNSK